MIVDFKPRPRLTGQDGALITRRGYAARVGRSICPRFAPLHFAIIYGYAEAALGLIERDPIPDLRNPMDDNPLMSLTSSRNMAGAGAGAANALLERRMAGFGPKRSEADLARGANTLRYICGFGGQDADRGCSERVPCNRMSRCCPSDRQVRP